MLDSRSWVLVARTAIETRGGRQAGAERTGFFAKSKVGEESKLEPILRSNLQPTFDDRCACLSLQVEVDIANAVKCSIYIYVFKKEAVATNDLKREGGRCGRRRGTDGRTDR